MLQIIKDAWIRTLVAFDVRDPLKRTDAPYVFPVVCKNTVVGDWRPTAIFSALPMVPHSPPN